MTSTERPSPWATTVVLADGESAFIRPIAPDDREALADFHERQSPESVYRRFFSPKPHLSEKELEHFTTVDMVERAALVVEIHDEFVAWASYERWSGRNEAEAAFMVDDDHHGRGIATLMLEHLAAIARTNGIERFTAEVLGDNRAMLAVFAKAGWPLQRRFDSGVVDLDWELATTDEFLDSVERREQRADSRAVARIFFPRAIAVIGASDKAGTVGNILWEEVRSSNGVPVHPVNPRLEDLDGRRCYGSVGDLPDDVALPIVAVPPQALESTIDACIQKRMRGAVIVTSIEGADAPEIDLEQLVVRSRRNGLRLIGPSSMGVAGLHDGTQLRATVADVGLPSGGVAVSMQSGSLGASLIRRARHLELGLSWFVSLGDKSDVSANDLLQFWEDDDNTKVIALYTESFGNPRKFARIARRVSLTRPIVAVRTGAAAHGSLGSAMYQQAGLIEVPSVQDLLDTCRVLVQQPILRGRRVALVTNSMSPATLAIVALESAGLEPVAYRRDLDWKSQPADFERVMHDALDDPMIDGVLAIYAPPVPADEALVASAVDAAATGASKPVVGVMIGSGDGPIAPGSTVPGFAFPEQAAATLGRSYAYATWLATEAEGTAAPQRAVDPEGAASLIHEALGATPGPIELDIEHAGELLGLYGIALAPSAVATPETAVDRADDVGYPVAVKARHRRVGRSARAGVALDLNDSTDVADAVSTMVDSLGDDAAHLTVQAMAPPGIGVRIMCERDERLGVIVSAGYGGIDADTIGDRTSRLAPVSPASARAMLKETRVGAAIAEAEVDPSPLVDTVVQAAQLCADQPDIDVLDLNPVIVSDGDAVVTDVRITLIDRPDEPGPLRRLT